MLQALTQLCELDILADKMPETAGEVLTAGLGTTFNSEVSRKDAKERMHTLGMTWHAMNAQTPGASFPRKREAVFVFAG